MIYEADRFLEIARNIMNEEQMLSTYFSYLGHYYKLKGKSPRLYDAIFKMTVFASTKELEMDIINELFEIPFTTDETGSNKFMIVKDVINQSDKSCVVYLTDTDTGYMFYDDSKSPFKERVLNGILLDIINQKEVVIDKGDQN